MVKIAVMSGKGGVGKSSVAIMVGAAMSERGRTLLLDFDLCGPSIARGLGTRERVYKGERGLTPVRVCDDLYMLSMALLMGENDAVIWRGPKKVSVLSMFYESADGFDHMVIDMPPGLSEEHEFLAGRDVHALIVTTPQNVSLSDASRAVDFCSATSIPVLGLVENMSGYCCENCRGVSNIFGSMGGERLAEGLGISFVCRLDVDPSLCEALDEGDFIKRRESISSYARLKTPVLRLVEELNKSI